MEIVLKIILALAGAIAGLLAVIGWQSLTRGTTVCRVQAPKDGDGPPSPVDPEFCDTLALLTKTTIVTGHTVEVFKNGNETYPRLWKDLRAARRSLTLQMYYCQPGRMADEFKTIILERAAAGVRVLFLRDAFGSGALTKEYIAELEAGGIEVASFRPTKWYHIFKIYHRSHIRVAVIDGAVGYTGGFGIDDKWLGDGEHKDQWGDTNARFTGPAVLQHQATFAAGWAEATGTLLSGDLFFPEKGAHEDKGEIYAGYAQRNFESAALSDVSYANYGGSLSWYVTPLATISLLASRDVQETQLSGTPGTYVSSNVAGRLDYEALRNLILSGRLGYEHHDYTQIARRERLVRSGVGATYLVNRNVSVGLDYSHIDYVSTAAGTDYARNQYGLTLKSKF